MTRAALVVAAFPALASVAGAAVISIPDAGFEGLSASVDGALIGGTQTGSIGAWTASVTSGGLIIPFPSASAGSALGGPTPVGTSDARFNFGPALAQSISLSQSLAATPYLANSSYTLSVKLDPGAILGWLGSAGLELRAGNNTVAQLSGPSLLSLLDTSTGFETVSLTYQTGSVPPEGNIGIYLTASPVLGIPGALYMDDFELSVTPVPEPAGLHLLPALALVGGPVVYGYTRKKRAASAAK